MGSTMRNKRKVRHQAEDNAEERVLDALLPAARDGVTAAESESATRQKFRKKLREGELDLVVWVSAAAPGVTPALVGWPKVARPEPAFNPTHTRLWLSRKMHLMPCSSDDTRDMRPSKNW